jgi:hypothetical protein
VVLVELLGECGGGQPEQHAQRLDRLLRLRLECREHGARRGDLRLRGRDVERADEAALLAAAREVGGALLRFEVLARDREAVARLEELHVVERDLRGEGDEHVAAVLDRGLEVGVGGLDLATDAAEEIDLPRRVEARLEQVARRLDLSIVDGRHGRARALVRRGDVDLRPRTARRDGPRRARLADARRRRFQVEVRGEGALHQRIELRVLERRPPLDGRDGVRSRGVRRGRLGRAHAAPVVGRGRLGRLEVGTDRACREQQQRASADVSRRVHSYRNASIGSRRDAFQAG